MKVDVLKQPEIYDLYQKLKYEPKFKSLDMSEKLHLLQRLGETYLEYKESRKTLNLNPEFILDNINERGFSRTRKVLEFCDSMEIKLKEYTFNSKSKEENMQEWKERIFHI